MKKTTTALTIAAAIASVFAMPALSHAATIYYDTNGTTAGTGTGATDWNSGNAIWSVNDPTGSSATVAWPASGTGNLDGSDVVFSAGTNAPTTYNINPAGSKIANSITVNEGIINLKVLGGSAVTRTILGGGITVSASTAGQSPTGFNANVGTAAPFTVILGASQSWTNNDATAPFSVGVAITGNATAGNTNTLTTTNHSSTSMIISSAITDGTAGGKVALTNSLGNLTLSGANTYSGGTSVLAGSLLLDNGGSLAHSNIVISGGSLAGGPDGTGGALTDNITNDLAEEILLSNAGTLNLAALNLTVTPTGTQTLPEYILANAPVGSANILGTSFASTNLPAGWSINYAGTAANPNAIVLIAAAATPEPASFAVLTLGAATLLTRRRKA